MLVAVLAGAVMLCACCVLFELRHSRQRFLEEAELKRHRVFNGLGQQDDTPIELIGSRPDDERPAGVDWSISMWGTTRGEYDETDRGFVRTRR